MKSLIFEELGVLTPGTSPDPTLPVWVKVAASGICGTDLKAVFKGHKFFQPPTVLGHEFYGQIAKAPEGYKYPVGTWVALAPYYDCGECAFCKAGKGDLCKNKKYVEGGSFAEYIGVPLDYDEGIFVLPPEENTDNYDVYALIEPLSCVLNGAGRLTTQKGYSKVLIVGGGPMGALFALHYAHEGIEVSVVEPNDERALALQKFGIHTVKFEDVKKGEYDNIVIAVNIASLVSAYLPLVREGGNILVFAGLAKGETLDIDAGAIHYSEVSVKGCSGFSLANFKAAFEEIKSSPELFRQLITNKFGFEDGQKAFDLLRQGKAFKVLLGSEL